MTLTTLRSDTRFLVFGNRTNTTYSDTDLDQNLNNRYEEALGIVLEANGDWQVFGTVATTSLVAGQRDYTLPATLLKLNQVYIDYDGTGEYRKANQRDPYSIGTEPDQADYGHNPEEPEFDLLDNSIKIYIPDDTIIAVTGGLKIHFQKDLTALSGSSDEPFLPKLFQRYLSVGAAIDYCLANEMYKKASFLEKRLDKLEIKIKNYYSGKSPARFVGFEPEEEYLY